MVSARITDATGRCAEFYRHDRGVFTVNTQPTLDVQARRDSWQMVYDTDGEFFKHQLLCLSAVMRLNG